MLNFLSRARLTRGTALAVLLAVSSTQTARADLVAYWNFNEGTGTVANDFTANNNDGNLQAIGEQVPAWIAGHTGAPGDFALNFAQGVVMVPDSASLHVTNQFTLAAWYYDTGSNYGKIFMAGGNWDLQTSRYGGDSAYFWSLSNANGEFRHSLGFIPPMNAWHHIAVTYNGSQMKNYIDGVQVGSTFNVSSALDTWGTLYLGGYNVFGSGFNGRLDDMAIFNTVENVTSIMNGTHPAMLPLPVWTGGGTPNGSGQRVWSDAANWGGTALAASNPLTFAAAAAPGATTNFNGFAANTQFTGITFNAGTAAFTLNGNAINLTGDSVNNSANSQTIANTLVMDGGNRTFNAASGNLIVINGIGEAQAGRGLVKSGPQTLTLGGTSSYTGTTSVNAGTLLLNGAALGNTATTVAGSTSILAGNGTVSGAVTAQSSGHLAPGVNATTTGSLILANGLTLNAANLDIKAATAGTCDSVSVTGNLVLTGNTQVNLTQQLAGFGLGDFVILSYTGTLTGSTSQILAPPQDVNFSYSIQTAGKQIILHVAAASAKTYYVSQSGGNDSNSGLTSALAWKTLAKASTVTLNAGDSILLQAGDTWNEELQPKGSGTAGNPIYIGSYGAGNKPLIDRLDYTQDRNGIHLIDQAGYKIVGIEFYRCMTGVYAEYSVGSPTRSYVWIEDCYFHDSLHYQHYEDYPVRKIGLGICYFSHETANNIVLSDMTVKNCVFRRLASGIWTNSPDNFAYFQDNIWNFANLNLIGCLFEEGYQWQLGLRGISGGQVTNCVTHDIGRLNNFVSFNGVAGAMMYRLKNFTFTDSEWGFISRGGGSFDGEAFDLEGNNLNMTFTRCLFHDTAGPGFMFFKGSNANPSNTGNLFTDCVWNCKAYDCPYSQYPKTEIFNASPGSAEATFASSRFYLSANASRCNNNTGMTFTNCLTRNLSAAASGTNLALATTAASSTQQAGFEASKGKDGNAASVWRPSTSGNEWLEITFASPTQVNEFRLREEAGSAINRYVIQYWDAATSTWAGCFNGRTMGTNFIAPIVTRTTTKLRLSITSTTTGTPGIAEFEAYYVEIPPPPSTAYWRVGDGMWDINTTNNWKNAVATPVNYVDGDIVFLDDTASGVSPVTITLNSTVSPTGVTVNGGKNYILTGTGGIGGATGLTKNNGGTLTLSNGNSYAGGTTINGGILSFGSSANLAPGNIAFNAGTLEYSGATSVGTYTLTGVTANVLVNVTNPSGNLTANRPGGNYTSLIKGGPGQLTLANAGASDSGNLTVNQGTVVLSGSTSVGNGFANVGQVDNVLAGATVKLGNGNGGQVWYDYTFHMSGGTFDLNGINGAQMPAIDGSGAITNSVAATTGTASFKINGNKSFSGSIMDGAGKTAITLSGGSGAWTLSGINTHTGNTAVNSGTLVLADNAGLKFALTNASCNSVTGSATATLSGDFTIDTSAVTATTGTWTLVNAATLNEAFTATFTVAGYTPNVNGVTWTRTEGTRTWTFTETDGKLVLSVSSYGNWAALKNLTGANNSPTGDPDNDGSDNLSEFAFHGNPLGGSDSGFHRAATEDTAADADTLKELTLTLAVRNGSGSPIFTASPSPTASVDGITYTIEGSPDLEFPGGVVTETAAPNGLAALPAGWEYRRFRLNGSNGLAGTGFLRAKVTQP